jgi:hypothetical protein
MHEYCTEDYIKGLKNLTYQNADILLIDNSKDEKFFEKIKSLGIPVIRSANDYDDPRKKLVECRNILREKVLSGGYDYFFDVDQDVIPPADSIERFLRRDKPVVTGIYFTNLAVGDRDITVPVVYGWFSDEEQKFLIENKEKVRNDSPRLYRAMVENNFDFTKIRKQLMPEDVEGDQLILVKLCGTGCLFVHRSVLEKIKFRENPGRGFDDMTFCMDLIENKIPLYADTSVKCMHMIKGRKWNWEDVLRDKFDKQTE